MSLEVFGWPYVLELGQYTLGARVMGAVPQSVCALVVRVHDMRAKRAGSDQWRV